MQLKNKGVEYIPMELCGGLPSAKPTTAPMEFKIERSSFDNNEFETPSTEKPRFLEMLNGT